MSSRSTMSRGRAGRISRSGDFDAVYQRGRSAANRQMVVYAVRRHDADAGAPVRLGLSVSRKVGDAVARNRVKRVLRERFAALTPEPAAGTDVVVIARPGIHEYLEERGAVALGSRLAELMARVSEAGSTPP